MGFMTKKQAIFNAMFKNLTLFDSAGKDEAKIEEVHDSLDSVFKDVLEEEGGLEYLRDFALKQDTSMLYYNDNPILSRVLLRIFRSNEENLAYFLDDEIIAQKIVIMAPRITKSDNILELLDSLSPNNRSKLLSYRSCISIILENSKISNFKELLKYTEIKDYITTRPNTLTHFLENKADLSAFKELINLRK